MAEQIIRQPDGRLAVFSSIVDAFVVVDATADELVEWRVEQAATQARKDARREVDRVLSGEPKPYYQFTLTWEEAAEMDRKNAPAAVSGPGSSDG